MADQQNTGPTLDQYLRSSQTKRDTTAPPGRDSSSDIPAGARDWINRISAANYRAKHPPRNDQRKPNRR